MIPGRRFQWALDEPISSVPMLRYPLSPRFCPPCHSFTPFLHFFLLFFLLHIFLFSSCFTLLFTYLSVNLSSCVSPVRFLSSSFYWPKFSISSFSSLPSFFLSFLFLFPSQTPGLYATWKASGLKRDITDPSLSSDTGTQKTGVLSYPRRSL